MVCCGSPAAPSLFLPRGPSLLSSLSRGFIGVVSCCQVEKCSGLGASGESDVGSGRRGSRLWVVLHPYPPLSLYIWKGSWWGVGGEGPWEGGGGRSRPNQPPRCHFSFLWPVTADKWDCGREGKKKTSEVSTGRGRPLRGLWRPGIAKPPGLLSRTPGAVRVKRWIGGHGAGRRAPGTAL